MRNTDPPDQAPPARDPHSRQMGSSSAHLSNPPCTHTQLPACRSRGCHCKRQLRHTRHTRQASMAPVLLAGRDSGQCTQRHPRPRHRAGHTPPSLHGSRSHTKRCTGPSSQQPSRLGYTLAPRKQLLETQPPARRSCQWRGQHRRPWSLQRHYAYRSHFVDERHHHTVSSSPSMAHTPDCTRGRLVTHTNATTKAVLAQGVP